MSFNFDDWAPGDAGGVDITGGQTTGSPGPVVQYPNTTPAYPDSTQINDSLMTTFGIGLPAWLSGGTDTTPSWTTRANELTTYGPRTVDASTGADEKSLADKVGSMMDKAGNWMEKNKSATSLIGRFVQGVADNSAKVDAAKKLADSRMAELNAQNQFKIDETTRQNASINGLRAPGLLSSVGPLKRVNGSRVFGPTGLISR